METLNPALSLTSHATLGQLPNVSEPQITHLCNGTVMGDYVTQNMARYSLSGSSPFPKLISYVALSTKGLCDHFQVNGSNR